MVSAWVDRIWQPSHTSRNENRCSPSLRGRISRCHRQKRTTCRLLRETRSVSPLKAVFRSRAGRSGNSDDAVMRRLNNSRHTGCQSRTQSFLTLDPCTGEREFHRSFMLRAPQPCVGGLDTLELRETDSLAESIARRHLAPRRSRPFMRGETWFATVRLTSEEGRVQHAAGQLATHRVRQAECLPSGVQRDMLALPAAATNHSGYQSSPITPVSAGSSVQGGAKSLKLRRIDLMTSIGTSLPLPPSPSHLLAAHSDHPPRRPNGCAYFFHFFRGVPCLETSRPREFGRWSSSGATTHLCHPGDLSMALISGALVGVSETSVWSIGRSYKGSFTSLSNSILHTYTSHHPVHLHAVLHASTRPTCTVIYPAEPLSTCIETSAPLTPPPFFGSFLNCSRRKLLWRLVNVSGSSFTSAILSHLTPGLQYLNPQAIPLATVRQQCRTPLRDVEQIRRPFHIDSSLS